MKFANVYVADTENTVPKTLLYQDADVLTTAYEDEEGVKYIAQSSRELKKLAGIQAKTFKTETWAFAVCPISKNPKREDVITWNSMDKAMTTLLGGLFNNSLIFFHNMAYDGKQMVDWLFKHGYRHRPIERATKDTVKMGNLEEFDFIAEKDTFGVSISGQGQWYEMVIATNIKKGSYLKQVWDDENEEVDYVETDVYEVVVIRDSLKILPFSVDAISDSLKTKFKKLKGSIDYTLDRYSGWNITPTEQKYIDNDVLVMAEAMYLIRKMHVTEMTIGSHAFKQFKKMNYSGKGKKQTTNKFIEGRYRLEFPELDTEQDKFLRKAYYGAITYNKYDDNYVNLTDPNFKVKKGTRDLSDEEMKQLKNGDFYMYKYDVNSMYPTVMYYDTERASNDTLFDFKYPYGSPMELEDEDDCLYKSYSDEYCVIFEAEMTFKVKPDHMNWFQAKQTTAEFARKDFIKECNHPTSFTITDVDFEQLQKHYEITSFNFVKGYYFKSKRGIFNKYIDYWYDMKNKAKAENNDVMYLLSKLMLNNLYGKFSQKILRDSAIPTLNGDVIKFETSDYELNTGYVPLGAYITAYARRYLVESIQENWDRFLYCDTDSMVLLGQAKGITIGDRLGDWDLEGVSQIGRFVRQKTYIMYGFKKSVPANGYKVSDEDDYGFDYEDVDGISTIPSSNTGKLNRKTIKFKTSPDGTHWVYDAKLDIKACGCPVGTKERMKYEVTFVNGGDVIFLPLEKDSNDNIISKKRSPIDVIERFTYGLIEAGKLSKKTVNGGSILFETTFAIL